MDPFDDDDIALLLRLKRDEQPPASYYENFLSEFRRRRRDGLRHQPLWSVCVDRTHDFVFRHNVRSLAPYPAAIAAVLVCGAVVSIRIYQQPEPPHVTLRHTPIPDTPPDPQQEPNLAPTMVIPAFDVETTLLPGSGDVPVLPDNLLRSGEFVPLKLEWESLDDQ